MEEFTETTSCGFADVVDLLIENGWEVVPAECALRVRALQMDFRRKREK